MKQLIITLCVFTFAGNIFSQTSTIKTQMEALMKKCIPKTKVYINKADNYLDIDGYQIPYMIVSFRYYADDLNENGKGFFHFVKMTCPVIGSYQSGNDNCILIDETKADPYRDFSKNGSYYCSGFSTPFKTKDDAYKFLDLIDQLKKQ